MIIPPVRIYWYAVKLAYQPVLWRTLYLWACAVLLCYAFYDVLLWQWMGKWFSVAVFGSYLLLLDAKVMVMILRHEEKKKRKKYRFGKTTRGDERN